MPFLNEISNIPTPICRIIDSYFTDLNEIDVIIQIDANIQRRSGTDTRKSLPPLLSIHSEVNVITVIQYYIENHFYPPIIEKCLRQIENISVRHCGGICERKQLCVDYGRYLLFSIARSGQYNHFINNAPHLMSLISQPQWHDIDDYLENIVQKYLVRHNSKHRYESKNDYAIEIAMLSSPVKIYNIETYFHKWKTTVGSRFVSILDLLLTMINLNLEQQFIVNFNDELAGAMIYYDRTYTQENEMRIGHLNELKKEIIKCGSKFLPHFNNIIEKAKNVMITSGGFIMFS